MRDSTGPARTATCASDRISSSDGTCSNSSTPKGPCPARRSARAATWTVYPATLDSGMPRSVRTGGVPGISGCEKGTATHAANGSPHRFGCPAGHETGQSVRAANTTGCDGSSSASDSCGSPTAKPTAATGTSNSPAGSSASANARGEPSTSAR